MMLREKIIKILGLLSVHFSVGVTEAFLLDHCPLIVITYSKTFLWYVGTQHILTISGTFSIIRVTPVGHSSALWCLYLQRNKLRYNNACYLRGEPKQKSFLLSHVIINDGLLTLYNSYTKAQAHPHLSGNENQ